MTYILLNLAATLAFIFFTFYIDKKLSIEASEQNAFSITMLTATIESVIYFFVLLQILFPFRLSQNSEQSSLGDTVDPCWLSILNMSACTQKPQTLSLSLLPALPLVTISSFSKSVSLFLFCR